MSNHPQLAHKQYSATDLHALQSMGLATDLANNPGMRLDSANDAGLFIARQLDYIKARTFDVKYPTNHALSLFSVSRNTNQGAQSVSWHGYDFVGKAQILAAESNDIPRGAITGREKTTPVRTIALQYGYSLEQIESSRFSGVPLESKTARFTRQAIDNEINRIAWVGDNTHGLTGVLTPGNGVPVIPAPNFIVQMTPMEIIKFVTLLETITAVSTLSVERPDTWAVPTDVFLHLTRVPVKDDNGGIIASSVAQWLASTKDAARIKKIVEVPELNPKSETLRGTPYYNDGAMFVFKKDPDLFQIEVPLLFDQRAPQEEGLRFNVPCRARTAGALMYYPMSCLIIKGGSKKIELPSGANIANFGKALKPKKANE